MDTIERDLSICSALEIVDRLSPLSANGMTDPDGIFVKNPVSYSDLIREKLDVVRERNLVRNEGSRLAVVPVSRLVTDQTVVVRTKLRSMIESLDLVHAEPPLVVKFEGWPMFAIYDGNHRTSAITLLGYRRILVSVVDIRNSFL